MHARFLVDEHISDDKEKPYTTHLDFDWSTLSVIQSKNVDESVNMQFSRQGKKSMDGKPIPWEMTNDPTTLAYDPSGRVTHVEGAWTVHPSDELMPTPYFTMLPDEPIGVGATWETALFEFPAGKSFAICKLKGIRHRNGHTLVDILYHVVTYEMKTAKETEFKPLTTPAKGIANVNMVFDVTEGRFLYGEGTGRVVVDFKVPVKGKTVHYICDDKTTFKAVFSKAL